MLFKPPVEPSLTPISVPAIDPSNLRKVRPTHLPSLKSSVMRANTTRVWHSWPDNYPAPAVKRLEN